MAKVQDLFKRADGSKILDTKLLMKIESIPTETITRELKDGTSLSVYPMKLSHQGQEFELELNQSQLNRIFTKTAKSGEVVWQAKEGDMINFWYASNKKSPMRPYFDAEPSDGTEPTGVEAAADVFDVPSAPAPAKKQFVKFNKADDSKWDGTPRQSNFRAGYAGILQAILSNPAVNPFDENDVEKAKGVTADLVVYVRTVAKELESSTKD